VPLTAIDKYNKVRYYINMNNPETNTIFRIYRDGKYDLKENLAIKMRRSLPPVINAIDSFFTNH